MLLLGSPSMKVFQFDSDAVSRTSIQSFVPEGRSGYSFNLDWRQFNLQWVSESCFSYKFQCRSDYWLVPFDTVEFWILSRLWIQCYQSSYQCSSIVQLLMNWFCTKILLFLRQMFNTVIYELPCKKSSHFSVQYFMNGLTKNFTFLF